MSTWPVGAFPVFPHTTYHIHTHIVHSSNPVNHYLNLPNTANRPLNRYDRDITNASCHKCQQDQLKSKPMFLSLLFKHRPSKFLSSLGNTNMPDSNNKQPLKKMSIPNSEFFMAYSQINYNIVIPFEKYPTKEKYIESRVLASPILQLQKMRQITKTKSPHSATLELHWPILMRQS